MKNVCIRDYETNEIEICPHISIFGEEVSPNESYEYDVNVRLVCKECNQKSNLKILVN